MGAFFADLSKLSLPEKLELLEELWDSIAADPDQVPVPDWHLAELDRRERGCSGSPQVGSSWNDVKARIKARHG